MKHIIPLITILIGWSLVLFNSRTPILALIGGYLLMFSAILIWG